MDLAGQGTQVQKKNEYLARILLFPSSRFEVSCFEDVLSLLISFVFLNLPE
jgi:hypothetical protein